MTVVNPNLLTAQELMGLLRIKRTKFKKCIAANAFPFVYIGEGKSKDKRFPLDQIEAMYGCKLYYSEQG